MSKRIKINNIVFPCPEQAAEPVAPYSWAREWIKITVVGTAADVKAAFVDDISYTQEWDSVVIAEGGTETTTVESSDLSDYSVAGEIVDTRDGNITVFMGKPTEAEILRELLGR